MVILPRGEWQRQTVTAGLELGVDEYEVDFDRVELALDGLQFDINELDFAVDGLLFDLNELDIHFSELRARSSRLLRGIRRVLCERDLGRLVFGR